MGSCLSKKKEPSTNTKKKNPNLKQDPAADRGPNGAAAPPLPEEEAVVKEVMTETPMLSSATTRCNSRRARGDLTVKSPGKCEAAAAVAVVGGDDDKSEEASEICSASECFSVSTTLTEKRSCAAEEAETGEEETSASKRWQPEWSSPAAKGCHHQRGRASLGESPVKREARAVASAGRGGWSSPSPVKQPDGRLFTGREAANRNAAGGMRRTHSERSGRRSLSPAAKQAAEFRAVGGGGGGVSRSSSMRKVGTASPRRAHPPSGAAAESAPRRAAAKAVLPSPGQKESVENPLVSLECFIFL